MLGTTFRLHNKRLNNSWILVILALVILLAACNGESETPTPPDSPTQTQPEDTGAEQSAVPQTAELPKPGVPVRDGTLRVAMQPMANLDPAFISSDSEVLIANAVYDYLVDIDPKSNIVPRLATAMDVSEDGLTYTFILAEGVTWHDGDPLKAEDVVWTFERLRDPAVGSGAADVFTEIADIQVTYDLEVTFTLSETNPFFLNDLSDNRALIIKQGTEDPTDFNGTGPFVVSSYSPEDRIVLKANEAYFIKDQPKLAGVEVIFFNDETASVDALRGGQLDLVMRMSTSLFESLQDEPDIVTMDIPTNGFDLVRFRADQPPGDDPRVIEALKLATDREAAFQLVQQGYGSVGNDSPISPLNASYFAPDIHPPARDVEAARALLAEAGYEDGLDIVLNVPDTGGRPDLAAVLKAQWAEAGIDVNIETMPESVYYSEAPGNWLDATLGITGWGHRPHPQVYLDLMLVCEAQWNESRFCDEEFDELVTVAGSTMNEAERIEAYRRIQEILARRGPIIIPYHFSQLAAISDAFQGFELKAFAGRTDFRDISLSE
ncbi:MAG: ABC transporter substrate-binding protein [Candidatus Promineifilaceae bacterium]